MREMDNKENRKEELYSQAIPAGKRRYFFDVKETRGGDKFITITESRKLFDNNTGEVYFEKNKMFLYKEDFDKFRQGLENAFSFIETGIVPPPVVVEEPYRQDEMDNKLDEIDFKY
ncbi:MAG: DUF3276 family protein [Bacteroidales bacterium]|jgi:hypothetical protein|nr:DUF3276 family protein [Bacteroidales bacterium]